MRARTVASPTKTVSALDESYAAERERVDVAYRAMQEVTSTPHAPAQARQAAAELTRALRTATFTVTRRLQAQTPTAPPPRHWPHRRRANRSVSAGVQAWSAELVRLSEIGVWLRRATLDDPGVHIPTTVRVGSYAATGPHIAGLEGGAVGPPDVSERRIGIDLAAVIDAASVTRSDGQ